MTLSNCYFISDAVKDLVKADLLDSVLWAPPESYNLQKLSPASFLELTANAPTDFFFHGAALDSRTLSGTDLFIALDGEHTDGRKYAGQVLQKGNWVLTRKLKESTSDPLLETPANPSSGVLVCSEPRKALAHLARCRRKRFTGKVVAVTGTNGKTTTKDFLHCMLSAEGKTQATPGNFNNELGLPLTLLNLDSDSKFAVIEMGASAVGDIAYLAEIARPEIGVITNASLAHLSCFGSLENIIEGKGELLPLLPAEGSAILNADSPGFKQWNQRSSSRVFSWGQTEGDHRWSWAHSDDHFNGVLVLDSESWPLPLPGQHNAANLCAAILACRALGVTDTTLRQGLAEFEASAHRGKLISWQKRNLLDDSYNANPASMLVAVRTLNGIEGQGKRVAVLGVMAELGADSKAIHQETGKKLSSEKLDSLLVVGELAKGLGQGYEQAGEAQVVYLEDQEAAAQWIKNNTQPGDLILLKGSRSAAMEKILDHLPGGTNSSSGGRES
ncbi:MAG: UDP-N-acetylmuramoyl-tripeptide--D-alanyl-D-alanine ligase [bacterium]|nr:UDP-N-acetylmuramoyl-tripeptide--D-alanyl-D-alanine ligase [bacterium]